MAWIIRDKRDGMVITGVTTGTFDYHNDNARAHRFPSRFEAEAAIETQFRELAFLREKDPYVTEEVPGSTYDHALDGTRVFGTGATRDADDKKIDPEGFMSPIVERSFSLYMHGKRTSNVPPGQTLRDSDNWQKGIPLASYMKSIKRHVQELWLIHRGYEASDEKGNVVPLLDALHGLKFNVDGYLHETLKAAE